MTEVHDELAIEKLEGMRLAIDGLQVGISWSFIALCVIVAFAIVIATRRHAG